MRKLTAIIAVAALAVAFAGISAFACGNSSASCSSYKTTTTASSIDSKATLASAHGNCVLNSGRFAVANIKVDGMTCGGCERSLSQRLNDVPGLVMVSSISSADGTAKVVYDKSLAKSADFVSVISDKRYSAEIIPAVALTTTDTKATSSKSGKSCQYSARTNGETATKTSGKGLASCNYSKGTSTQASTTTGAGSWDAICCQLTQTELEAFCEQFCKIDANVEKIDS